MAMVHLNPFAIILKSIDLIDFRRVAFIFEFCHTRVKILLLPVHAANQFDSHLGNEEAHPPDGAFYEVPG